MTPIIKPDDRVQFALFHSGAKPITARVVLATENGRALVLALDQEVIIPNQRVVSGEVVAIQRQGGEWNLTTGEGSLPIQLTRIES